MALNVTWFRIATSCMVTLPGESLKIALTSAECGASLVLVPDGCTLGVTEIEKCRSRLGAAPEPSDGHSIESKQHRLRGRQRRRNRHDADHRRPSHPRCRAERARNQDEL